MHRPTEDQPTPDIYIGIMSGTSLDGIDVAAVKIDGTFELIGASCYEIPHPLRKEILALTSPTDNEIDRLGSLDTQLGLLFADCANSLIESLALNRKRLAAIGSHGQTIRHRPELGFTLQIGDPNIIAEKTGITTVADFRRRDMSSGGQGAPLVPAFHHSLFHSTEHNRIIVNIGGMANITILKRDNKDELLGYDTGPGNVLLDSWINHHTGNLYDKNGEWAATGRSHNGLLRHWLNEPFFSEPPPKSTGRELFNLKWINQGLQAFSHEEIKPQDIQATLLELTAVSISDAIKQTQLSDLEIYLCGGGAHNPLLLESISHHIQAKSVSTTSVLNLDPDWVEAAAFAWLAHQTGHQRPGNHPAVTGAQGFRILGGIFQA